MRSTMGIEDPTSAEAVNAFRQRIVERLTADSGEAFHAMTDL
jgi:hypothetical protein